jgi:hypothetical protein
MSINSYTMYNRAKRNIALKIGARKYTPFT